MKIVQLVSHNNRLMALDDQGQVYVRQGDLWVRDTGMLDCRTSAESILESSSTGCPSEPWYVPTSVVEWQDQDGDTWYRGEDPGVIVCPAIDYQFRTRDGVVQIKIASEWHTSQHFVNYARSAIEALWQRV